MWATPHFFMFHLCPDRSFKSHYFRYRHSTRDIAQAPTIHLAAYSRSSLARSKPPPLLHSHFFGLEAHARLDSPGNPSSLTQQDTHNILVIMFCQWNPHGDQSVKQ